MEVKILNNLPKVAYLTQFELSQRVKKTLVTLFITKICLIVFVQLNFFQFLLCWRGSVVVRVSCKYLDPGSILG